MIKITVLGDSLCLARKTDSDIIEYEETWPFLLQSELSSISNSNTYSIVNGKRKRTVRDINHELLRDYVEFINPKHLIFQIGVVDAAPRIFSKLESRILNFKYFPNFLKVYIINYRKRNRQQILKKNSLKKVYTNPKIFKNSLQRIHNKLNNLNFKMGSIIFLPIIADIDKMEKKSPGYSKNLKLYNQIISTTCNKNGSLFLHEFQMNFDKNDFCDDGYHLNKVGNKKMSTLISNKLISIEKNS